MLSLPAGVNLVAGGGMPSRAGLSLLPEQAECFFPGLSLHLFFLRPAAPALFLCSPDLSPRSAPQDPGPHLDSLQYNLHAWTSHIPNHSLPVSQPLDTCRHP